MHFFSILYIFGTVLILTQCQEFQHDEGKAPHNVTAMKSCPNHMKEIFRNRANVVLKPRERHVVLKPEPGYEFNPPTVSVNRCNGYCPGLWSPMPTKMQMKEFVVHRKSMRANIPMECVSVAVEEHMHCRCKCMKNKKDCSDLQDWDEKTCACPCKGHKAGKEKCESNPKMVWDTKKCSCICNVDIMECSSGLVPNIETCRCEKPASRWRRDESTNI